MPVSLRSRLPALLGRIGAACLIVGTLSGGLVVSCAGDPPSSTTTGGGGNSNAPSSQAMGQWTPTSKDTCTKAQHDSFFVVGPDGKKYPTWHPASYTDPASNTSCTFGHEHGSNPAGSAMWAAIKAHFAYDANNNGVLDSSELASSGIAFGYVSEQLATSPTPRTEAHTAYKVAFGDAITRSVVDGAGTALTAVTCDLFAAYNQPTHDADAFASTMYSVTYGVDCTGNAGATQYPVKAIVSVMAIYGSPGSFTRDTANTQVDVSQAPVPATSPGDATVLGRRVPIDENVFAGAFVASTETSNYSGLIERWDALVRLRRADLTTLASFAPQFRVDDPARYYSIGSGTLARSIDLCYTGLNAAGALVDDPASASTIVRQVRGDTRCAAIAPNGPATSRSTRVAYDAVNSAFRGCARSASFGAETVSNVGGPTTWYTSPFGENAGTTRFTNSVKQLVTAGSSNSVVLGATQVGSACDADANATVHVPN